jgi:hypothetical protein
MTVLEEACHTLIIIEHDPLLYEALLLVRLGSPPKGLNVKKATSFVLALYPRPVSNSHARQYARAPVKVSK